jgi:hypothetical protein
VSISVLYKQNLCLRKIYSSPQGQKPHNAKVRGQRSRASSAGPLRLKFVAAACGPPKRSNAPSFPPLSHSVLSHPNPLSAGSASLVSPPSIPNLPRRSLLVVVLLRSVGPARGVEIHPEPGLPPFAGNEH